MKKNNKKGFTIVELVIVIAVIAILAAVLIPTFSNVIQKANQSAALQVATSTMKSTLGMSDYGTLENGTIFVVDDFDTTKGYRFAYEDNKIDSTDAVVAYNTSGNTNRMNSIIINTDNIEDGELKGDAKTIIEGALSPKTVTYTPIANKNYAGTITFEGSAAVLYTFAEYTALEGKSGVTEDQFNALSPADKTKEAATPASVWYVFTNTDYAMNVVTFTYSKVVSD